MCGQVIKLILTCCVYVSYSCAHDDEHVLKRPNIVFFLADDLDLVLGGMEPLQKTRALLQEKGVRFENAFVTTPLCCPSRSSILTGLYAHHHGTTNNSVSGGCGSRSWQEGPERTAFATQLAKNNYTTFYAGKYLNQYGETSTGGPSHIPPGWHWWNGLVGNSVYYNYNISMNGKAKYFGNNPDSDYLTSVISNMSLSFLDGLSAESSFFMMLSPPCPHAPFTPLPKYAQRFADRKAPRTPNFNYHAGNDKHWLLRTPPNPLPQSVIDQIDDTFRNRWRTLLSLDDMVESVVGKLDEKGILNNTYIIFTSDHGYHLGQFSLPWDKRQPYEFDIRVPFLVRGPGIGPGTVNKNLVLNIDLAPTFLDLAGTEPEGPIDGRSIVPVLFQEQEGWQDSFIVEHKGEGVDNVPGCPQYSQGGVCECEPDCICQDAWNNTYTCIRKLKPDILLCHFKDDEMFIEEYNLTVDPFQMNNLMYPNPL